MQAPNTLPPPPRPFLPPATGGLPEPEPLEGWGDPCWKREKRRIMGHPHSPTAFQLESILISIRFKLTQGAEHQDPHIRGGPAAWAQIRLQAWLGASRRASPARCDVP